MDLMAKFVGKGNMIVEVPKYGYKSYCRTWSDCRIGVSLMI